jgi:hypothetical protein
LLVISPAAGSEMATFRTTKRAATAPVYAKLFNYGFGLFCEDVANDAGEFPHLAGIAGKTIYWREARDAQLK